MNIYFDFKLYHFNIETPRSGGSKLTTWKRLTDMIYLKDVSFGVVTHPFNPKEISFRRKTFTPYKPTDMGGKDYGIAIKGTAISESDYNNLVADTNPVPMTIRKLFHKYGDKFYQSYPSLVKFFKEQDKMSQAVMNPSLSGTRSIHASRKFPTTHIDGAENWKPTHFVPRPVFAMQIIPYSTNCGILFDEKQTADTGYGWHNQIDSDWATTIAQRYANA